MDETMQLQTIEQAKRRDQAAIYQLYADTRDRSYFTARVCVQDEKALPGIIKDSYISALGNLEDIPPGTDFGSWVQMVVASRCVSYLKTKKVKFDVKDPYMGLPDNSELFPPEWAEEDSRRREILGAVERLPEPQRMAVMLHYYGELTLGDMGRCMGIDDLGANTHLSGAKATLKSGTTVDVRGKPAMTRLLECMAPEQEMPAEMAKAVFQDIMLVFMTGGVAPKPAFLGGKSKGGGGGSKLGAMLPYLIMIVVVILALVFFFVRFSSQQKKIGAELVAEYEASKAAVDQAEQAYQEEAQAANPPGDGDDIPLDNDEPDGDLGEPVFPEAGMEEQPESNGDDPQPVEPDMDGEVQDT